MFVLSISGKTKNIQKKWRTERNGGISCWGEWLFSGSWTCRYQISPKLNIVVVVMGRKRPNSWGMKPYRWHGWVVWNGAKIIEIQTTHPSCKSIEDACRYAKRDGMKMVPKALEKVFTKDRVVQIAKKEKDELIPYISCFGNSPDTDILDYGEYICKGQTRTAYTLNKDAFGTWGKNKAPYDNWMWWL